MGTCIKKQEDLMGFGSGPMVMAMQVGNVNGP